MDIGNRTIWLLWFQGFAAAPPMVQLCLESWRRRNPGWRVMALDAQSLGEQIDLDGVLDLGRADLTIQAKADIARLALLRRHGGVWVDASAYCFSPLDDWLPAVYSGFAAFANPGRDRLMSNWFIAAEKDHPLLVALYDTFIGFMAGNTFPNQNTPAGAAELKRRKKKFNRNTETTLRWLKPRVQKRVGAYPYYVFHYCFNKVVLKKPELRALWDAAALERRDPARLKDLGAEDGALALAMALDEIGNNNWLLQKLNHRVDGESPYWRAVLARLAELNGAVEARGPATERRSA